MDHGTSRPPPRPSLHRPLAGARAWIVSDGKAGHEALSKGVAGALGVTVDIKRVAPHGIWKAMAPWGPVSPREKFGEPGAPFAPPWPDIAIAAGRTTLPYLRALKRRAGLRTYTVVLMDPKTPPSSADLYWVPEHDRRRGPNVIATLTAPHPFSADRLAEIRAAPDPGIARLPSPRVAVLVGGPNDRYRYATGTMVRLTTAIRSLADLGASLMITVSRRTPAELVTALEAVANGANAILWNGEGPNPYAQFLAHADAFLVTADSINMAGEAAATGRPISIFEPEGGADKFTSFHDALRKAGITRPAPERFSEVPGWSYQPVDAARVIADEIERRWQRRRSMLPGLT
jgi:uncharacterized protein